MENGNRKLILNWCPAHDDLKRSVEEGEPGNGYELGNGQGWTYLTFFPKGTNPKEVLYDIDEIRTVARENHYHLPFEIVAQHNKVVLTAYSDGEPPISPLPAIFAQVAMFAQRFNDTLRYPAHGIYGKFGGIYERPEKGRVLAIYSRSDEALLSIYESLERLISEIHLEGFRFELSFSNGLSAIPRMLDGFDDPEYRHTGNRYFRITDPNQFALLLDQARKDFKMYRFEERNEAATIH
jgi:hypothetical protein